jgi:hypothetical protein
MRSALADDRVDGCFVVGCVGQFDQFVRRALDANVVLDQEPDQLLAVQQRDGVGDPVRTALGQVHKD